MERDAADARLKNNLAALDESAASLDVVLVEVRQKWNELLDVRRQMKERESKELEDNRKMASALASFADALKPWAPSS